MYNLNSTYIHDTTNSHRVQAVQIQDFPAIRLVVSDCSCGISSFHCHDSGPVILYPGTSRSPRFLPPGNTTGRAIRSPSAVALSTCIYFPFVID